MPDFVFPHLPENCPAAGITGRQAVEVSIEVLLDLAFGLDEKPHAPSIAGRAGCDP